MKCHNGSIHWHKVENTECELIQIRARNGNMHSYSLAKSSEDSWNLDNKSTGLNKLKCGKFK